MQLFMFIYIHFLEKKRVQFLQKKDYGFKDVFFKNTRFL